MELSTNPHYCSSFHRARWARLLRLSIWISSFNYCHTTQSSRPFLGYRDHSRRPQSLTYESLLLPPQAATPASTFAMRLDATDANRRTLCPMFITQCQRVFGDHREHGQSRHNTDCVSCPTGPPPLTLDGDHNAWCHNSSTLLSYPRLSVSLYCLSLSD